MFFALRRRDRSNIPSEIQDAIENQSIEDIEAKLNLIDNSSNPSSPLMAITDEELYSTGITTISPLRTLHNSSIWHNGIPNQIPTATNHTAADISPLEFGVGEDSFLKRNPHLSFSKFSQAGVHVAHRSPVEISVMEGTSNQASSAEVGITNNSVRDIAAVHENSSQVSTSKINSDHTNFLEISSPQINIPQNNSLEVDSRVMSGRTVGINQLDSSKVTFPIVVPDQQVFSGDFPNHNSTPEIINVLNNSATNIWSDLLQSEASLDIDFQITDLPKGQLAEVTITGFDDSGKPNAGTILIDHDANGVG